MNEKAKRYMEKWNAKRPYLVNFIYIDNPKSYSPGKARNIGVRKAKGDILVFIDDDTILLQKNAFTKIIALSSKYDHGYGAKRLWTKPRWFERNSDKILGNLQQGSFSLLRKNVGQPPHAARGIGGVFMQTCSFIANFGFCRKESFGKAGGFPDLAGYGFDDDWLMSYLYENNQSVALLEGIEVAHVSHAVHVTQTKFRNLIPYFTDLVNRGFYWFHVDKILKGIAMGKDDVLEPLGYLHYDPRIERAFADYEMLVPLNLDAAQQVADVWKTRNRYSKTDFARIIHLLMNAKNLDAFVRESRADFDNLATVIEVAKKDCVRISKSGTMQPKFEFKFTQPYFPADHSKDFSNPSSEYNQFPCDEQSRKRRIQFLKQRYPFCEYLKFALIGDDDLVSSELVNDYWAWPIILEKDSRIVKELHKLSDRFDVVQADVLSIAKNGSNKKVQTFMTDPPYTLHGALSFIVCGLQMLDNSEDEKEFYVVLNETMMGKSLNNLLSLLSAQGVQLHACIPNFSQYKLPSHYEERRRADAFLRKIKIDPKALRYSSSSNLYIFKTANPNIKKLSEKIDASKMYEHFA